MSSKNHNVIAQKMVRDREHTCFQTEMFEKYHIEIMAVNSTF
jgi:hypothetical protein